MRKLIALLLTFMILSFSSLAPCEPHVEEEIYTKVKVGYRILFLKKTSRTFDDKVIRLLLHVEEKTIPEKISPKFKQKMGILESGGNYDIVNQFGYIGKYQFSEETLKRLINKGYLTASKEELKDFRNNPNLQEMAMDALIISNLSTLRNYKLGKYIGTKVNGVKITVEGMLAAAHLLGPYAVKHYITTGSLETIYVKGVRVAKYDANGTSIVKYLKHFI